MSDTQVKHIRAGSIVPVNLTLSQINGIYQVHQFFMDLLGQSGIEALKTKYEAKQPLDNREMSMLTITTLIQLIHKSADEQGLTELKSLESSLSEAIASTT